MQFSSLLPRRTFLKTSAAAGAGIFASRFPALGQPSSPSNLSKPSLSETFVPLASSLLPLDRWTPYPKAGQSGWLTLHTEIRDAILKRADEVASTPWPSMLATDELEFKRNGNRSRFEAVSFGRRNRLGDLVLAECIDNKGKYIDHIANGVWLICEESFWGVPAHLGAQKAGVGLADEDEPIIELFGAETCATLGWVVYLLGRQLDTVSPRIVERVHLEATRRILVPYFLRTDFGWMGLSAAHAAPAHANVNNWNPWINSNVLISSLLLERDTKRRSAMVAKICRSVDEFLADYSPDAACEEGPGYWGRSAASFFDCCSTLVSAHGGHGDGILKHPFTRGMGHYICNVHIAGENYVNYGDAHVHDAPPPDLAYRFGRATGDEMLARFGAFNSVEDGTGSKEGVLTRAITANRGGVASLSRALATVLVSGEIAAAPVQDALPRDAWYPALGLMTARQQEGSADGFYLAIQAASNGRSHGHNDSGSFIIFHNGEPVFIDVGTEAYTAKTFGKDRYTIWTMQSGFHNLPTVNGVMQHEGVAYRANGLRYESSSGTASLRADLASAYPKEAEIRSWVRTVTLDRSRGILTIVEDFSLRKPSPVTLSLMAATEPHVLPSGIRIGGAVLAFDQQLLAPSIERIPLTDENLRHSWGEAVYRVKLSSTTPLLRGVFRLELRAA